MPTEDWVKFIAISIPVISIFIEITPIKFNPISWILSKLGSKINKNLNEEVDKINKLIQSLDQKVDQNEIYRLRQEILAFSNSCQRGITHSKDEFEHIIDSNTRYHNILKSRDMVNGQIDAEFEYIMEIYENSIRERKFL